MLQTAIPREGVVVSKIFTAIAFQKGALGSLGLSVLVRGDAAVVFTIASSYYDLGVWIWDQGLTQPISRASNLGPSHDVLRFFTASLSRLLNSGLQTLDHKREPLDPRLQDEAATRFRQLWGHSVRSKSFDPWKLGVGAFQRTE